MPATQTTASTIPWLSPEQVIEKLKIRPCMPGPLFSYSTLLGGWTESTLGCVVGLDDHGFHRGDGVFEALRVINRRPYLIEPHLQRLRTSAERIGLRVPWDLSFLQQVIQTGIARYPEPEALLRLFVTRGPGGFSTNPLESQAPHLFCVLMPFRPVPEEKYVKGVRIGKSAVGVKDPWLAITKSLNYLPNVMMKKESLERGLDFTVSFDHDGGLGESSTENIVVLSEQGELVHPPLSGILKGCTMTRLFDLVEVKKLLPVKRGQKIRESDLYRARGAFMVGTTLDVISVSEYEGEILPATTWSKTLRDLLIIDQQSSGS